MMMVLCSSSDCSSGGLGGGSGGGNGGNGGNGARTTCVTRATFGAMMTVTPEDESMALAASGVARLCSRAVDTASDAAALGEMMSNTRRREACTTVTVTCEASTPACAATELTIFARAALEMDVGSSPAATISMRVLCNVTVAVWGGTCGAGEGDGMGGSDGRGGGGGGTRGGTCGAGEGDEMGGSDGRGGGDGGTHGHIGGGG